MVAMVQVPAAVPSTADTDAVAPRSYLAEVRTRFLHNRAGVIAVSALVLLAVAALVAPLLSPYDPLIGNATRRLLPIGSAGHPLGTDEQGRDMLTRLLYGGRLSLLTGMLPVLVATVIGTAIGATAGYLRGPVGAVLMRTMDMLYAFPAIMLAIAISASLGPGVTNSVLAISMVFIATDLPCGRGRDAPRHHPRIHRSSPPERGEHGVHPAVTGAPEHLQPDFRVRLRPGRTQHRHRFRPELPRHGRAPACARMGLHAQQLARRDLRAAVGGRAARLPDLRDIHVLQHDERRPPRCPRHQGRLASVRRMRMTRHHRTQRSH